MAAKTTNRFDENETWFRFSMMATILGILGLCGSIYALFHHLEFVSSGATDAACNISSQLNCDAVAASEFSEVFGQPIAIWGILFFLTLICSSLTLRFSQKHRLEGCQTYAILASSGFIGCLILAGISIFSIEALCPSCLAIYLVCTLQLALVVRYRANIGRKIRPGSFVRYFLAIFAPQAALLFAINQTDLLKQSEHPPQVKNLNTISALSTEAHDIPLSMSPYSGLGEDYRQGRDDAKVKITVFSDFQCPSCRHMSERLELLRSNYGESILIVFKNYPLDIGCNAGMPGPMHQHACKLATLARCAGRHGKFWQYHDIVYSRHSQITSKASEAWASELGLSSEQIESCLSSTGILDKIREDIDLGNKLGVNSTPTIFINGFKFVGKGIDSMRAEIERILKS